jgi:hypothetical protein
MPRLIALNAWVAAKRLASHPRARRVATAVAYAIAFAAVKAVVTPLISWTNLLALVLAHDKEIALLVGALAVLVLWVVWGRSDVPGRHQLLALLGSRRWIEISGLMVASTVVLWVYDKPVRIERTSQPLNLCKVTDIPTLTFDRWDEERTRSGLGRLFQPSGDSCQLNPPRGCDPPACAFGDVPGHAIDYIVLSIYGGLLWPTGFNVAIDAGTPDVLADVAYSSFLLKTGQPSGRTRMQFKLKDAGRSLSAVVYFTRAAHLVTDAKGRVAPQQLSNKSFADWFDRDGCRGRAWLEYGYASDCS